MVPVSLTKSTLSFKTNIQKSRFARIGFFVAKNSALIKHLLQIVFLAIALLGCGNLAQAENTQLTSKLQ